MAKIKQIAEYLESIAPKAFQESYDNSGLIVGNPETEISRILICLDSTEDVIDEAVKKGCNLVIAHHPLIFRGLKKLTPDTYVERAVVKAIKNDVAIYALHTNLDNVSEGVNKKIGEKIGLKNLRILSPRNQVESKLVVFVPEEDTRRVLDAMHEAGAGVIGNYTRCSFRTGGIGSFEPGDEANPHIGRHNKLEEAPENRVEVIFPAYLESRVLAAMKQAHPYEEAAYFLHRLENKHNSVGAGMIGELEEAQDLTVFLKRLKEQFQLNIIKYTESRHKRVKNIAVCGGAGIFLLKDAIAQKAEIFLTSDIKYHEFFDAEGKITLADIGHYESEQFTKELIYELLNRNFTNIALEISELNTNPVRYL